MSRRTLFVLSLASCLTTLGGGFTTLLQAGDEFRSSFTEQPDRRWVGPDFLANRLQDWRVTDGWLTCTEGRANTPMRTCGLLTREIDPSLGGFTIQTELRATAAGPRTLEEHAGFLFGIGGPEVDPKIRALVQGVPAKDGGILAIVDGHGQVAFRSFTERPGKVGFWSIDGALPPAACRMLEPARRSGPGFADNQRTTPLVLELTVTIDPDGTATALLRALANGVDEISRAEVSGLSLDRVDGSISLVSHRGPASRGHAFRKVQLSGSAVVSRPERAFGPVLGVLYTVHDNVLKLTAQLPPLGEKDPLTAELQIPGTRGKWQTVAIADRRPLADTCTFRLDPYLPIVETPFRVVVGLAVCEGDPTLFAFDGVIRREPGREDPLTLALISCVKNYTGDLAWNGDRIWFPHADVATQILAQAPDLFLCAGDQIYEGDLSGAVLRPDDAMILDYQTKWHRWLWSFGAITRVTPTVVIPDDHDVYHGNLWGAANISAPANAGLTRQDAGGYKLAAELVNAIHATQTSHLPDAIDPEPIAGGISVYHTRLEYAGVSLAIVDDRMWKSAPSVTLPEANIVNGWAKNPDFDWVKDGDPRGAELLGARQEQFLADWAVDYSSGAGLKVLLSQSVFANVATLPAPANSDAVVPALPVPKQGEYPEGEIPVADADSNGWPRSARNRAVSILTRGSALHLTGDQHLASVIRYGVETPGDAGWCFGGPSVANTWPRRWFPSVAGKRPEPGAPSYTGDFFDGFGNPMRVVAVANPVQTGRRPGRLHDRVPGFGLVRLDRAASKITLECWPRGIDLLDPAAEQYPGWPITIDTRTLDGRAPWGHLPTVTSPPQAPPQVVRVRVESTGEILSARRLSRGETWAPPVYAPGIYIVEIGDGDGPWQVRRGQRAMPVLRR